MTRTQGAAALVLGLGIALAAGPGNGRAQEGTGERVGEQVGEKVGEVLDRAGQAIRRGVDEAAETIQEGFARTRTAVHNMGVEGRVYGRIHWDRALTDAAIELETRRDGVVVLRGSVPSAEARAKAVLLAQETVGVTQVVDQLTIGPAAETPPATTTTTTTIRRPTPTGPATTVIERQTTPPEP